MNFTKLVTQFASTGKMTAMFVTLMCQHMCIHTIIYHFLHLAHTEEIYGTHSSKGNIENFLNTRTLLRHSKRKGKEEEVR